MAFDFHFSYCFGYYFYSRSRRGGCSEGGFLVPVREVDDCPCAPLPLPLPTAVEGGGASLGAAACSFLLEAKMDPISADLVSA